MASWQHYTPNVNRASAIFFFVFSFPCGVVKLSLACEPANMSNKKHKDIDHEESGSEDEQDSGSERDSDFDSDGNFVGDKELQADFEGRNPEDCDFHGIKQLLRQLFLKTNVDLGALTQTIISQNYVGSVVKQCLDDPPEEDDDEDDGSDGVFGVTTVINITKRKSELDKAIKKNMPYTFQYLIWICKTYNTGDEATEVLYANQEEKPLAEEALASFDVDVSEQVDFSQWEYEGGAMTPGRKV
ncbi:hypothetical protein MSG28_014169, partial [Choristoneura fumiferana]